VRFESLRVKSPAAATIKSVIAICATKAAAQAQAPAGVARLLAGSRRGEGLNEIEARRLEWGGEAEEHAGQHGERGGEAQDGPIEVRAERVILAAVRQEQSKQADSESGRPDCFAVS